MTWAKAAAACPKHGSLPAHQQCCGKPACACQMCAVHRPPQMNYHTTCEQHNPLHTFCTYARPSLAHTSDAAGLRAQRRSHSSRQPWHLQQASWVHCAGTAHQHDTPPARADYCSHATTPRQLPCCHSCHVQLYVARCSLLPTGHRAHSPRLQQRTHVAARHLLPAAGPGVASPLTWRPRLPSPHPPAAHPHRHPAPPPPPGPRPAGPCLPP